MDDIKKEEISQEARIEKAEQEKETQSGDTTQVEEQKKTEIEIKYPDDNGCCYFNYCKAEVIAGRYHPCYFPGYFVDKLERKCSLLIPVVFPKKAEVKVGEEEKITVREQIKKEIIDAGKKTFTVVDIIKQEVARGNKDEGLVFQALKAVFPNEKDSDLRKRIKPTISYLEKKAGK